MPNSETVPIEVVITVSIGDKDNAHTLRFTADATARGAYYHGDRPAYEGQPILEENIRGTVDTLIARVGKHANRFIANAYPVHFDRKGTTTDV